MVIMLYPFAPHLSAELWSALRQVDNTLQPHLWNKDDHVWMQSWPIIDHDAPIDFVVMVSVVRDRITIERY
jgi:leucyl-tRNA synthetase